jgi:hypothetical protein
LAEPLRGERSELRIGVDDEDFESPFHRGGRGRNRRAAPRAASRTDREASDPGERYRDVGSHTVSGARRARTRIRLSTTRSAHARGSNPRARARHRTRRATSSVRVHARNPRIGV